MTREQKLGTKVLVIFLGAVLILSSFVGCATGGGNTIVLGEGDWDSFAVQTRIAGFILENGYDYEVTFVVGGTIPLAAALTRGDVDVLIEAWTESTPEAYADGFADGSIVELGIDFADSWQGWLVPTYMIEDGLLPEGVSVADMPDYWELFRDPEDPSKGRFYNCIPGWVCEETNQLKMEAYGLTDYYNVFPSGSSAALSASMLAAYEKGEPWFGYNWQPTPIMGALDMTKLEEPAFDVGIWDTTRACAYPTDKVVKLVTSEFMDGDPAIVDFFTKYEVTATLLNQALAYMQENNASTEEAGIWFLQEFESLWTQWVPADIASKVKAALP
ncbi:MAG: ABC transporter substrate-binding protein [Planctomycetota bacterium]|jgi:glycine betaine/proline transport system substrate-binding protein